MALGKTTDPLAAQERVPRRARTLDALYLGMCRCYNDQTMHDRRSHFGDSMSSTARPLVATKRQRGHCVTSPSSEHNRSDVLAAVLQIAGQIAGILEIDPLVDRITQQTQALLGYRDVALLLVEDDTLAYRACAGEQARLGSHIALHGDSMPAQALRSGVPVWAPSSNAAAFPLISDERSYGVLEIARSGADRWSDTEIEALTALARQATSAIQSARRYTATQRRVRELTLLDQIRSSVIGQPSLRDLLRDVVDKVATTLGYALVSLYTLRGEQLLLKHQIGYAAPRSQLDWNNGALGHVARSGMPLLRRAAALPDTEHAAVVTSSLCVALRAGGVVYGILCVESAGPHLLDADDQRLLLALADQVDIAIEYNQLDRKSVA